MFPRWPPFEVSGFDTFAAMSAASTKMAEANTNSEVVKALVDALPDDTLNVGSKGGEFNEVQAIAAILDKSWSPNIMTPLAVDTIALAISWDLTSNRGSSGVVNGALVAALPLLLVDINELSPAKQDAFGGFPIRRRPYIVPFGTFLLHFVQKY